MYELECPECARPFPAEKYDTGFCPWCLSAEYVWDGDWQEDGDDEYAKKEKIVEKKQDIKSFYWIVN